MKFACIIIALFLLSCCKVFRNRDNNMTNKNAQDSVIYYIDGVQYKGKGTIRSSDSVHLKKATSKIR